jgi:hypothetical protein
VIEADDDGPLINGRPVLTIAEVQQWAREVHAHISDDGAALIARELNQPAFEGATLMTRNEWSSMKMLTEISDDLRRLKRNLSKLIMDTRRVKPDADISLTEQLLCLIDKHKALITETKRGRPADSRSKLPQNIRAMFCEVRASESHRRPTTSVAANDFAAKAAKWVLADPAIVSVGKTGDPTLAGIGRQKRRKSRQGVCIRTK